MPKKIACASEKMPAYPSTKFSVTARMALMPISTARLTTYENIVCSLSRAGRLAEEARGTEDDEREQDDERDRLAPLRTELRVGEVLGEPEQKAAAGRATNAADAADNRRREADQHDVGADRRVQSRRHRGEDRAWNDDGRADHERVLGKPDRI